jgi:hypothetical protein
LLKSIPTNAGQTGKYNRPMPFLQAFGLDNRKT